jgi:hypothetical protein
LRMCPRHLLMNTWSLCRRLLVVFQVSAPYKRMVFTLELNNRKGIVSLIRNLINIESLMMSTKFIGIHNVKIFEKFLSSLKIYRYC